MRARFSAGEIAAAALRLVDGGGLAALSMRSLAAALGTGPMTLYNYVADKEDLEELVVAAVVAEVRLPEASSDWERDAFSVARAIWEAVRAHPAAIPRLRRPLHRYGLPSDQGSSTGPGTRGAPPSKLCSPRTRAWRTGARSVESMPIPSAGSACSMRAVL